MVKLNYPTLFLRKTHLIFKCADKHWKISCISPILNWPYVYKQHSTGSMEKGIWYRASSLFGDESDRGGWKKSCLWSSREDERLTTHHWRNSEQPVSSQLSFSIAWQMAGWKRGVICLLTRSCLTLFRLEKRQKNKRIWSRRWRITFEVKMGEVFRPGFT